MLIWSSLARKSVSETRAMAALTLLSIIVGMVAGFIGAGLRYALERADGFRAVAVAATSAYPFLGPMMMVGAALGLLAWYTPHLVGGGDGVTQNALNGDLLLVALPALFLFRLALGTASYAAGTPGGLFAPLMVLGAVSGLGFGYVVDAAIPGLTVRPEAFALVGMGAFFAGSVRASLTGIVLVIEMTGSSTLLLPLLAGCFVSMLVAETLREAPIYAALKAHAASSKR